MAITSLQIAPPVGEIGKPVSVAPVGTPVGTERRFYLLSAPPSSSLVTLATYADLGLTLADARLTPNAAGQGVFTPDVVGAYTVVCRDITVYRFQPHYGGDVPPLIPGFEPRRYPTETDNDGSSFTTEQGTTAEAADVPTNGASFYAYQTLSRAIGFGPDTAKLTLRVYGSRVADGDLVDTPVALTAPATAPAKVAVYDATVLATLDLIATLGVSDATDHLTRQQTLLGYLVTAFNEHIALDQFKTHTTIAHATTDPLASTADVTASYASIETRLDDLAAKYNAHRVRLTDPTTSGILHPVADNTNAMPTATIASDADAILAFERAYSKLRQHATANTYHDTSISQDVVDGYLGWCAEPPSTLAEVAQAINGTAGTRWENFGLTWLYEKHRLRATNSVHHGGGLAPDTSNGVLFLSGSTANLITTANALAGALVRHIQNQDSTGAAAATPYHFADAQRSRLPVGRASDVRSLALLIEELWLCMESHLWSAGPSSGYVSDSTAGTRGQHADRAWGFRGERCSPFWLGGSTYEDGRPALILRLQKAFDQALGPNATAPAGLGNLPVYLQLRAGFSLPASPPSPPSPAALSRGCPCTP